MLVTLTKKQVIKILRKALADDNYTRGSWLKADDGGRFYDREVPASALLLGSARFYTLATHSKMACFLAASQRLSITEK